MAGFGGELILIGGERLQSLFFSHTLAPPTMVNPGQGSGAAAYGGDDVSALVLDAGTYWTKAGYAGEDTPTAVFASDYRRVGSGGDMDVDGQQSSGPSSPYVYGESAMLFREHAQVRSAFNKDDGTGRRGCELRPPALA